VASIVSSAARIWSTLISVAPHACVRMLSERG
jgi:hypothetical protein